MDDMPLGAARYEPEERGEGARNGEDLSRAIQKEGIALGFARLAIASSGRLERGSAHLEAFRANGFAGTMRYLMTGERDDPKHLLPQVKSVVVAALAYGDPGLVPLRSAGALFAEVARYARGQDYHHVMKAKLIRLAERIASLSGAPILARACVDTAPLLERELAREAGLGFQGKSGMLIAPGIGSTLLLGELLVDIELEPLRAIAPQFDGCGSCSACLEACPTAAFVAPYVLDARRCISYLTIEFVAEIPREHRRAVGTRVFGCDVCQEVCPFNASSRPKPLAPELAPAPRLTTLDLSELLFLGSAAFRRLVKHTALRRASRATLQRNAAVALGNTDDPRAVAPLTRALETHPQQQVRAHAAWALGELSPHLDAAAVRALRRASEATDHPQVANEAGVALSRYTALRDAPR